MREEIANNVQREREKNKLTQQDFAEALGVTRQTIISLEKGNYTPSVLLALKIAQHFRLPVEKLFSIVYKK